jgi:hypothetical protein
MSRSSSFVLRFRCAFELCYAGINVFNLDRLGRVLGRKRTGRGSNAGSVNTYYRGQFSGKEHDGHAGG